MEALKQRILQDGHGIGSTVVKVDSFLNHQIDVNLLEEIGREFKRRFQDQPITKILTIEASGIAIACMTAHFFKVPVLFAKKAETNTLIEDQYTSEVYSFTKNKSFQIRVSKKYLHPNDHVLILDDFLANGNAALGLVDLVKQANAKLAGVGIVIEKGFQNGRKTLQEKGIKLESLVIIDSITNGNFSFQ